MLAHASPPPTTQVIVLGNKMNGVGAPGEGQRRPVRAFTLHSLQQLTLTKTFDTQMSVLTYVQNILRQRDPDLLHLGRDFGEGVLAAAKRLPVRL